MSETSTPFTVAAGTDYSEMAAEMLARAKTYPGFLGFKSFKADDGDARAEAALRNDEPARLDRTAAAGPNPPEIN
jgi:antibiotic biosynthesis monooxygenase (ABM) superfamily enzyme